MSTYYIYNTANNLVLDLSGSDNTTVITYPLLNGANQQWKVARGSGGTTYQNVRSGTYLAPVNNVAASGVGLTVSPTPYPWTVSPVLNLEQPTQGIFRLKTKNLAAVGGGPAVQVVLQITDECPTPTTSGPQIWTYKSVS